MTILTFVLAGAMQNIIVALICVAAAVVAGIAAFFFLRAKNREAVDSALSVGAPEAGSGLGEMRELTSRIEDIVLQQQDNGETQRQHLSRKIDSVKESVESQHHAVTGLRQELRHEVQKRDAELTEIRTQIEAVREGVALPPADWKALPAAELGAPEAEGPFLPLSFESDDASGDDLAFTPFEDVTFESDEDSGPAPDASGDSLFAATGFEEASFEDDSATPGPFLFTIDPTPAFDDDAEASGDGAPSGQPFSFEELPDPLSFSEEAAPFAQEASPLFEEDASPFEEDASPFEPMSFSFNEEADPGAPFVSDAAGMPTLNDPDPLGFEEVEPLAFEDDAPVEMDAPANAAGDEPFELQSMPLGDLVSDERTPEASGAEPLASESSVELSAPESSAPVFEDATASEESSVPEETAVFEETAALGSAPTAEEPMLPEQSEETGEPAEAVGAFEIVSFLSPEADAQDEAPEAAPPALSAEREEGPSRRTPSDREAFTRAASGASQASMEPPVFETTLQMEEPETPPTAWISRPERGEPTQTIGGIEIDQVGDVPPMAALPVAEEAAAPEASAPEASAPEATAAEAAAPEAAPESSLPELHVPEAFDPETLTADVETPEAPVEANPRFDVAPAPEAVAPEAAASEHTSAAEAPDPTAELASGDGTGISNTAQDEDDFPAPVVASELAAESSFDFGIDIEAEMAFAEEHGADQPEADTAEDLTGLEALFSAPVADEPAPTEPVSAEPLAPEPPAAPEPGSPESMLISADSFFTMPPSAPASTPAPAPEAPQPEAQADPAASGAPQPTAAEPAADEVPAFEAPEGAEDLTVISSVDNDVQRALYMADVLTLDEIARWGRSDARRISSEVGVSEETIMHQWVFEAQAALFDRFSR